MSASNANPPVDQKIVVDAVLNTAKALRVAVDNAIKITHFIDALTALKTLGDAALNTPLPADTKVEYYRGKRLFDIAYFYSNIDPTVTRALVDEGADPSISTPGEQSALTAVALKDQHVLTLITQLQRKYQAGSAELKQILDRPDGLGRSVIVRAARGDDQEGATVKQGNLQSVMHLVEAGADFTGNGVITNSVIWNALNRGQADIAYYVVNECNALEKVSINDCDKLLGQARDALKVSTARQIGAAKRDLIEKVVTSINVKKAELKKLEASAAGAQPAKSRKPKAAAAASSAASASNPMPDDKVSENGSANPSDYDEAYARRSVNSAAALAARVSAELASTASAELAAKAAGLVAAQVESHLKADELYARKVAAEMNRSSRNKTAVQHKKPAPRVSAAAASSSDEDDEPRKSKIKSKSKPMKGVTTFGAAASAPLVKLTAKQLALREQYAMSPLEEKHSVIVDLKGQRSQAVLTQTMATLRSEKATATQLTIGLGHEVQDVLDNSMLQAFIRSLAIDATFNELRIQHATASQLIAVVYALPDNIHTLKVHHNDDVLEDVDVAELRTALLSKSGNRTLYLSPIEEDAELLSQLLRDHEIAAKWTIRKMPLSSEPVRKAASAESASAAAGALDERPALPRSSTQALFSRVLKPNPKANATGERPAKKPRIDNGKMSATAAAAVPTERLNGSGGGGGSDAYTFRAALPSRTLADLDRGSADLAHKRKRQSGNGTNTAVPAADAKLVTDTDAASLLLSLAAQSGKAAQQPGALSASAGAALPLPPLPPRPAFGLSVFQSSAEMAVRKILRSMEFNTLVARSSMSMLLKGYLNRLKAPVLDHSALVNLVAGLFASSAHMQTAPVARILLGHCKTLNIDITRYTLLFANTLQSFKPNDIDNLKATKTVLDSVCADLADNMQSKLLAKKSSEIGVEIAVLQAKTVAAARL